MLSCPCVYLVGIAVTSVTLASTLCNKQGKVGSVTQYSLHLTDGAPANPVGLIGERSTTHAVPRHPVLRCAFPMPLWDPDTAEREFIHASRILVTV